MFQTMTTTRRGARDTDTRLKLPPRSAGLLEDLGAALAFLSAQGHERMTLKQSLFFLTVAHSYALGESTTLMSIIERFDKTGSLGGSIRKSYNIFLPPTPRDPEQLGWIEQVEDPDDRRYKYLRLTKEGADVVTSMLEAYAAA